MNNLLSYIPPSVSTKIGRTLLHTQKSSPTILFAVGVVGVVATAVSASRATLRMDAVIDEAQANLDMAHTLQHKDYSDEDMKQDIVLIYAKAGVKIARLYAPPVVIGILTIACLTKSHNILNTRNAGLAAAYAALDRGFREYRARVIETYGPEDGVGELADKRFRYDSRIETYTRKTQEGSKEIQTLRVGDAKPSIYATFFDNRSKSWSPTPEYNLIWLRCQQNYFNDKLKSRGHVFLNEIYDVLGVERTPAGSVVGWIMGRGGDEYIDFGIFATDDPERILDFVQGHENTILLDFNVDGVIYDKI